MFLFLLACTSTPIIQKPILGIEFCDSDKFTDSCKQAIREDLGTNLPLEYEEAILSAAWQFFRQGDTYIGDVSWVSQCSQQYYSDLRWYNGYYGYGAYGYTADRIEFMDVSDSLDHGFLMAYNDGRVRIGNDALLDLNSRKVMVLLLHEASHAQWQGHDQCDGQWCDWGYESAYGYQYLTTLVFGSLAEEGNKQWWDDLAAKYFKRLRDVEPCNAEMN